MCHYPLLPANVKTDVDAQWEVTYLSRLRNGQEDEDSEITGADAARAAQKAGGKAAVGHAKKGKPGGIISQAEFGCLTSLALLA